MTRVDRIPATRPSRPERPDPRVLIAFVPSPGLDTDTRPGTRPSAPDRIAPGPALSDATPEGSGPPVVFTLP